jgi:hypothetical protein
MMASRDVIHPGKLVLGIHFLARTIKDAFGKSRRGNLFVIPAQAETPLFQWGRRRLPSRERRLKDFLRRHQENESKEHAAPLRPRPRCSPS